MQVFEPVLYVVGTQYRSAIYYHSEEQREAAAQRFEEVNRLLSKSTFRRAMGSRVVSELAPAGDYFIAEKVSRVDLILGLSSKCQTVLEFGNPRDQPILSTKPGRNADPGSAD